MALLEGEETPFVFLPYDFLSSYDAARSPLLDEDQMSKSCSWTPHLQ
jgi:hypothetical protein